MHPKCAEQSSNRLRGGGKRWWNQMKCKCYIDYFWGSLFVRSKILGNLSLNFVFCMWFFLYNQVLCHACSFHLHLYVPPPTSRLVYTVGDSFSPSYILFSIAMHPWENLMSSSKKPVLHFLIHPFYKPTSAFLHTSIQSFHIQNLFLLFIFLWQFCSGLSLDNTFI